MRRESAALTPPAPQGNGRGVNRDHGHFYDARHKFILLLQFEGERGRGREEDARMLKVDRGIIGWVDKWIVVRER